MADLTLVNGEFGMNIDFTTIDDETGQPFDLTPVTVIKLNISKSDFTFSKSITLNKLSPNTDGISRWLVASGDIPAADVYFGQIVFTEGAVQLRKSRRMDFKVEEALPTA